MEEIETVDNVGVESDAIRVRVWFTEETRRRVWRDCGRINSTQLVCRRCSRLQNADKKEGRESWDGSWEVGWATL